MQYTVLLDMDGVVANFLKGVCNLFNLNYDDMYARYYPHIWDIQKVEFFKNRGITNDMIFSKISMDEYNFWVTLEQYDGAKEFYDNLCSIVGKRNVVFSTSPSLDPLSSAGKVQWLKLFTQNKSFNDSMIGHRKDLMANQRNILIDDNGSTVLKFMQLGGNGILFPRPWNEMYMQDNSENYTKCCEAVRLIVNDQ